MERGAGRVSIDRIPYPVEQALKTLEGLKHIVLVGSRIPVAFFAYPDKPSVLTPEGCQGHVLARPDEDLVAALDMLAEAVGARDMPAPVVNDKPPAPAAGAINPDTLAVSISALLPENGREPEFRRLIYRPSAGWASCTPGKPTSPSRWANKALCL